MKVIVKEPGKKPEVKDIPNTLKAFQEAVGGYIEACTFLSDLAVICDEEGRLKGKEPNCSILGVDFVGTILVVGINRDGFTDVPLTLEAVERCGLFQDWMAAHMNTPEAVS